MNDKRKIEINIIEVQTHKILIQINSNENQICIFCFITPCEYDNVFAKHSK